MYVVKWATDTDTHEPYIAKSDKHMLEPLINALDANHHMKIPLEGVAGTDFHKLHSDTPMGELIVIKNLEHTRGRILGSSCSHIWYVPLAGSTGGHNGTVAF